MPMQHVAVRFEGIPQDPSLEAAVERWVARLESRLVVERIEVTISAGRLGTTVRVVTGAISPISATRPDPYVAVSDAFRAIRRRMIDRDCALAS